MMRNLLAALALIAGINALLTAPAAAQAPCLVATRGLSFQQWYRLCARQVAQTCTMVPMSGPACIQEVAQAEYQTYLQSQSVSMACSVPGMRQCINGWLATCNGTLFITSARRCY
jgi:hypothetical protein